MFQENTPQLTLALFHHWLGAVCRKHGLSKNVVVEAEGQQVESSHGVLTVAGDLWTVRFHGRHRPLLAVCSIHVHGFFKSLELVPSAGRLREGSSFLHEVSYGWLLSLTLYP